MYVKRSFAMSDPEAHQLLRRVARGNLVSVTPTGLTATLLPLVWDPSAGERGALLSHMMRVNPQWRESAGEVLLLVDGLDHYVSAEWLPVGDQVPTWNYETVHVHGELVVHDDVEWCRDIVQRTVAAHEERWRVEDSGEDIEGMLRAIVGIEIRVTRLEAKQKLSQNRHPAVIEGIADALDAKGMGEHAAALRERSLPVARARQELIDAAAEAHARRRPDAGA